MSNKSFLKIKNRTLNLFIAFTGRFGKVGISLPLEWFFAEHAGVENVEVELDFAFE